MMPSRFALPGPCRAKQGVDLTSYSARAPAWGRAGKNPTALEDSGRQSLDGDLGTKARNTDGEREQDLIKYILKLITI